MKTAEKKMLLSHIKKDSKEFRGQLEDDKKLRAKILGASMKKEKEKKESKMQERMEDKGKKEKKESMKERMEKRKNSKY